MTDRFCVGCRWYDDEAPLDWQAVCRVEYPDVVTGTVLKANATCRSVRYQGPCGPEGRLWEGKDA